MRRLHATHVLTRTLGVAALLGLAYTGRSQNAAPSPSATINQYCAGCHNSRLKTGGLVLDPAQLSQPGAHADTWEKVVRKLRSGAMPPVSVPRPDAATSAALVSYLETELDRSAAARPNPGKLPLLHRLTRTEYQNAIRDLLDLQDLPKEIDFDILLPADNSSSGFDNLADLLFVSPSVMERYLDAARKISRLALGDANAPVMVNTYRLHPEHSQDERVEELSFGTRGGLAIRSVFPLDGEYLFKLEITGGGDAQQAEITVDGERKELVQMGGGGGGRRGRAAAQPPTEFRIPITAGPHLVGVTFIERNEARDEATLRPRMRGRGTLASLAGVIVSGPYNAKGLGDTPTRKRVFVCRPSSTREEDPCAKQILTALARRAFRRPVNDTDLQDLLPFYTTGRAEGGFDLGIQKALERLLVSPQFLFRIEREPANIAAGTPYRITDLELGSRLSFFLWSSIPDDELLNLASAGKLRDAGVLEQQVRRMLADERSKTLTDNFAAQWLFLRDIRLKEPDEILFPDYDQTLRRALERETELFVDSVLRSNRSVLELLTANYTFLNERLAKHYGVPNIEGSYFRRVTFPEGSPRGGLLGQGSILTLTSYSIRTSPVLRGKWVLENLLGSAPPPPPANVPALKTEGNEPGKMLSMREAMSLHRASPACAGCHANMDPIGFAMENFDAVGRWRDRDASGPLDVSGALPDGRKFEGVAGLKQLLLKQPELFTGALTEKLLMYALGRNVQYFDAPVVRSIVREAAKNNSTFESLVLGVAKSAPFQMRESAK